MNTKNCYAGIPATLRAALIATIMLPALPMVATAAEVSSDVTFVASANEVWAKNWSLLRDLAMVSWSG